MALTGRPEVIWDKNKELAISQKILMKFHCAPCDPPGQCPNLTQNAWGADVKPMGKKTARCYGFHDAKKRADRRRVPFAPDGKLRYWCDPCPKWRTQGKCAEGDMCYYSHTDVEQLYHPAKYKTAECEGKKCWGDVCAFIHKPVEARRTFAHLYLRPVVAFEAPQQVVLKENWWVDYKTRPCMIPNCARSRYCMDAHPGERRRQPYRDEGRLAYEPAQAENELEFYYHPEIYRREFCPSLRKQNTPCAHDRLCHRAHTLEEFHGRFYHPQQAVFPQPFTDNGEFMVLRWKTVSCPWLHWPHIWARCPYHHRFHNQNMASLMKPDLDWRRTLYNDKGMINYWPEPCPVASEGKSCPHGIACENTHTKAEFMYHPEKYRRRECQYGGRNCPRSIYCAFIHPGDPIGNVCTAAQLQQIMLEFSFEDVSEGSAGSNLNGSTDINSENLHESNDDSGASVVARSGTSLSSSSSFVWGTNATTPPPDEVPAASAFTPPAAASALLATSLDASADEEGDFYDDGTGDVAAQYNLPPHTQHSLPLAEHLTQLMSELQSMRLIPWSSLHFTQEDLSLAAPDMSSERALLIGGGIVMLHTVHHARGSFATAAQQLKRLDKLNSSALVNAVSHLGYTVLPRRLDRSELPEIALITEFVPHSESLLNALLAPPTHYHPSSPRFSIFRRIQEDVHKWSARPAIARQIILGLCRLHEQQFFVGNLRSSNVLISLDWEKSNQFVVKISALGAADPSPLAPELKEQEATATGDVYNFGILLQELLTLAPSLDAKGLRDDRPLATFGQQVRSSCALEWAELVRQCCAQQATRRPTVFSLERSISRLAEQEAGVAAEALLAAKLSVAAASLTEPVPPSFHAPKRKMVKSPAVPVPAPTQGMLYQLVQAPTAKGKGGR